MSDATTSELDRIKRERDLYARLLDLGNRSEIDPFLEEALSLMVEISGAKHGYLEFRDPLEEDSAWSISHGFSRDEVETVRTRISSGIIAQALSTGQIVDTPSALLDPRFAERGSVRTGRIEAVLCVPVGQDPPLGALYLQGREQKGPFEPEDRERARIVAEHLAPLVHNLIERRRANANDDATAPYRAQLQADGVIGRSTALASLLREVSLVAPLDVSVLLTGESGTGKSQITRVIHDNGPRAGMPLVEVNCAALPETLIESELFGALPGSHSTATTRLHGKVEAAEKGTLFLDEVSELAPAAQSKLLQLLQSKTYYPLGATEPSSADVRILAATNTDLDSAVADGRFREDLLYRLQVLPVRVPSLAERRDDVPELAAHFVRSACERHRLPSLAISSGAVRALEGAEWPGNVRQLEHALEAAAIRAAGQGDTAIERRHVFPARNEGEEADAAATFQEATRSFQRQLLRDTLVDSGWNVTEAARRLDLARSHIYNLIKAFGLERGGS